MSDKGEVFLPVVLIALATAFAAAMSYGTHPDWAQYPWGLDLIMISRRLQWPLVAMSLIACVVLLAVVGSGKRRVFWLIGLAPVLALFVHRFSTDPINRFAICDEPTFLEPRDATFLADEEYVVGLTFREQAYAYPYRVLYTHPVVVQADHDKRLMLMWSASANHASAVSLDRGMKARELEIVSTPANALLLYNAWLGQFINAVTARTPAGDAPHGFGPQVSTVKTSWQRWRAAYPQTRVMAPPNWRIPAQPIGPIAPAGKMPPATTSLPLRARVTLVAAADPIALRPEDVTDAPLNLSAGGTPVLAFRDSLGVIRAFDRRIDLDLSPRFKRNTDARRKGAAFVDVDTDTGWSEQGVATDGDRKGQKLTPLAVDEDVYWGVMKHWYPGLTLYSPQAPPPGSVATTPVNE